MTQAPGPPGHRSVARRTRLNATTVLAVVLPVLCAAALLLVRPADTPREQHPPTRTALTSATVVCPTALAGAPAVSVTSAAARVSGRVSVGLGKRATDAEVSEGRVTTVRAGPGPVAVTGSGETAPGLVAARFGDGQQAAVGCPAPAPQQWFTGVGAGASHNSVLELVNPDAGTAVADVTVYGRSGVIDAPRLRGVSVPGHRSVRLDLSQVVPRRGDLAMEVVASRGRIGATVLDRYDEIGSAPATEDWLAAQADPAASNLLMGLAQGDGERTLMLANPGEAEVRADVRVVTDKSVFAPEGLSEIRVGPQSLKAVPLPEQLTEAIKGDATGLVVTSSAPVTATLSSVVDGDVSHAVGGVAVDRPTATLVPAGDKRLLVADARRAGTVTVVSRSATGKQLGRTKIDVRPGSGASVELPDDAALVTVTPARTSVTGSVLATDRGAAVVPLVPPVTSGLVPDVRPGLS